jgi:carbamoyltransferase
MRIFGIWDGHDAGACVVEDGEIKVAINEERLTRRKLDIRFPINSIKACLEYLNLKPADIEAVAITGTQLTRVMARQFRFLDDNFYKLRRRLIPKPRFEKEKRFLKYFLAKFNLSYLKGFTAWQIKKKLEKLGFKNPKIYIVDHHLAHAASAIFTSGFKKSLCITLDGVGDGLAGTVNVFENDEIERISEMKEKDSIGLFFEEVTTILGFRELEDEGKVMAMADYSYPIPEEKNKLIDFFKVNGLKIKAKHPTIRRFVELEKIKWSTPSERFAYMAQKTLEKHTLHLFKNAIEETGIREVCWAGGVASNIKLNRVIRLNSGLKDWFVFPQMGDGGLAVGAALYVSHMIEGIKPRRIEHVYFGLDFDESKIEEKLKKEKEKVEYEKISDPAGIAADLLQKNNYLFWFQGRMEYGPRALGNRSILAPADSEDVKDELNLMVKQREWFQPFCPSILEEDSKKILEDWDGKPDKFMTMGYMLKKEFKKIYAPVSNVDGSVRPQMVGNENQKYRKLLEKIKKEKGVGIVLNTSFNIHGEPIVCSPADALTTMIKTKTKYMILGDYLVILK